MMQSLIRWVVMSVVMFGLVGMGWSVDVVERKKKEAEVVRLKVMSFNIRYATESDRENQWEYRKRLVVDVIKKQDPDVLGVQEALSEQWNYLRGKLKGYGYIGAGRDDGRSQGEACGIYFKRKRVKLIGKGHVWLSEKPTKPGSKGWDSSLPRMFTWVKLKDVKAKETVWVINTHWDHRGKKAREESAKLITQWVEKAVKGEWGKKRVVVMGDMNSTETSKPIQVMNEKFADAYRELNEKSADEGTFNGFAELTDGKRIDYVFSDGGLKVVSAVVDYTSQKDERSGKTRLPSDHYPVVVEFEYVE
ncbi:endonuclease/exonuclease/phosphatase family protein [Planctomycetota bacterium]|nr:endonuclease/exonuclease/phosphatase family protein [Planctomycetota bacterium]